uniref:Uncharacterized protein n=1 Tax=Anguilla anguilla TaxID=7936 RepID=A0A0E9P5D1_ANGAN
MSKDKGSLQVTVHLDNPMTLKGRPCIEQARIN